MLVHAALHVHLLDLVQLLSLQLAIPVFQLFRVQFRAGSLLDHSTLDVSIACLQHFQKQLKIFECCAFAMHGCRFLPVAKSKYAASAAALRGVLSLLAPWDMFRISDHMWHVRFSRGWFSRLLSSHVPRFPSCSHTDQRRCRNYLTLWVITMSWEFFDCWLVTMFWN